MKQLIPAGWVEKPCRFFCHESAANSCGFCEGEFGFWNGRRHCHFCGHVFHRRQCTRKIHVDGLFFRRRICSNCDYYRNVASENLKKGEEFVCVSRRGSGTVFISLCEDTAELILRWKATGITETVDLLQVKARKGFSHRGRLNSVGDYDPLRSISLFLGDGFGDQRSFDVRASSAWSAQLWVDGLTAARYVYCCMLEQDSACESLPSNIIADRAHRFKTQYLPEQRQTNILSRATYPGSVSTYTRQPLKYVTSTNGSHSDNDDNNAHNFTKFSKSGYFSDRSLTPTPTHNSLPSRYRQSRPHTIKSNNRWSESTPGLPYINSPFSSICRCHAYEITPSKSVDVGCSEMKKHAIKTKCCRQCKNACQVAVDIDNL